MKIRKFMMVIVSAFPLCSCVNPLSSLYNESSSKLTEDARFVESYRNTICDIKKEHEYKEITSGKCLARYYDYKDQPHLKEEKEEVVKRVRYILENPEKFDQKTYNKLSKTTVEIANCDDYILLNCM